MGHRVFCAAESVAVAPPAHPVPLTLEIAYPLSEIMGWLLWIVIAALGCALIGVGVEYAICRHGGKPFPHGRLVAVLGGALVVASASGLANAILTDRSY